MTQPATRGWLLELREEQGVAREGYTLLDEKRLLLVGEILRQLARLEGVAGPCLEGQRQAGAALRRAVGRHGLEGLQLAAAPSRAGWPRLTRRRFFGVELVELLPEPVAGGGEAPPPDPSAALGECRRAYAGLLERGAELAVVSGNLHRLLAEYRRTERRARALEEVILPELEEQIAEVDARLEELDQEEAVRVRLVGR